MTNQHATHDVCALWQEQPTEPMKMPPEEMRKKLDRLQRTVYWRNLREYVAVAIVVAAFGYYTWKFPDPFMRLGSGLTIAGALYVAYMIHRKASARVTPLDMALNSCVDFYKLELERQRDALRSVWSWYLLPFVPGMSVFLFGMFHLAYIASSTGQPHVMSRVTFFFGAIAVFAGIVFFAVWKLNQWAAMKLEKQINKLDALTQSPDSAREG